MANTKPSQDKKKPVEKKANTRQMQRTADNRGRRQAKEGQRQVMLSKRKLKFPRGAARALRRDRWAHIRQKSERFEQRYGLDAKTGQIITYAVKVPCWKPTFAEFSKGGQK